MTGIPSATTPLVNASGLITTAWQQFLLTIAGGATVPTAAIMNYGGATAPAGYLPCNGAAVSRTTYANLFAVIGTTYGAGDGSTTFNVPNIAGSILSVIKT